jgi:hypothetical protein
MIDRAPPPKIECYAIPEDKPDPKPNPFKIGESVRLRDGTATNGTVSRILGNEVLIEWDNVPGDPRWYHQDFVSTEKRAVERGRSSPEGQPEQDIVDHACHLVARMDDNQRRRFMVYIRQNYK